MKRDRVEEYLSEAQTQAIGEICDRLRLPFEHWPEIPFLRWFGRNAAGLRLVQELQEGSWPLESEEEAIRQASFKLGVKSGTLRSALKSFPRYRDRKFKIQTPMTPNAR